MSTRPAHDASASTPFAGGAAYASPIMRRALGDALRPGGLDSTRSALRRAPLLPGSLVLDAGCGPGQTAALLRDEAGCRVIGLDREPDFTGPDSDACPPLVRGDASSLPLAARSLDAVFCECVLSLLASPELGLAEFHRVLKPGGRLYLGDVFARAPAAGPASAPRATCLAAPAGLADWRERLRHAGFAIVSEEDQTWHMRQTAGRLIFEHGSLDLFWQAILGPSAGGDCAARIKDLRPGYVSFVAIKETAHV
ncbi:DVU_1556 family methyltransferase [Desulfohalovibrio reitneri]|uniref:DVU_1556 family methyltransferase n=1 Tax=Desulfohalovibrio reitneri TaxID=1307759 RepID=UPI000691356C|nr:class I SAM-dependent methyltransferase [Desulfohalovibrio reitneri]